MAARDRMEKASKAFQKAQDELSAAVEARQKLESQLRENDQVRQEFAKLAPGAGIYKKIGPALVRQEHDEASQLVDKRIEFIKKEITRVEELIKTASATAEKTRAEALQLQAELQAPAQA